MRRSIVLSLLLQLVYPALIVPDKFLGSVKYLQITPEPSWAFKLLNHIGKNEMCLKNICQSQTLY